MRAPTGMRLKERRRAKGLTQAALAERVGISASYLNLIENGKRSIGGRLLVRLAEALDADIEALDAASDRRLIETLSEIAVDPIVRDVEPPADAASALVGRHPNWARAVVSLYRGYRDRDRLAQALSDRLNQDPFLNEAVHRMLSNITAISSSAEILNASDDMPMETMASFHGLVAEESTRLAETCRSLVAFFEKAEGKLAATTPAEEVDDFLAHRRNYFDALELAAEDLRRRAGFGSGGAPGQRLIEYLVTRRGIDVRESESPETSPSDSSSEPGRDAASLDAPTWERARGVLTLPPGISLSERRFVLARAAIELDAADVVDAEIMAADALNSDAATARARRVLINYGAGAALAPYEPFIEAAETARYDVESLSRRFGLSYEQTAHRLSTLRRPGGEGVPFAFLRVDAAGFVSKRFALPNLPLPRNGGGCPLWASFLAFQTPGVVTRQLAEFPNGERFLFIARTVDKRAGAFPSPPRRLSVTLAADAVDADRLVYADDLALDRVATRSPVGPSCQLCGRLACPARQEDLLVAMEADVDRAGG